MANWLKRKINKPKLHKWFAKQKLRWGTVPKPDDPNTIAKGKSLIVEGSEKPVKVEKVTGNIAYPKKFEINGEHLISILDFYCQLKENRRPTDEEIADWDSIELMQVDVPRPKKETIN